MKFVDLQNQAEFELLDSSHLKLSRGASVSLRSIESIERLLNAHLVSMSDVDIHLKVFLNEVTKNSIVFSGEITDIIDILYAIHCLSEDCKNKILTQYLLNTANKVAKKLSSSMLPSLISQVTASIMTSKKVDTFQSHPHSFSKVQSSFI